MLTLSPSAVAAVDTLLHSSEMPDEAGLRICAAGEAELTIEFAPEPAPDDQVIEEGGARLFIEPEAAPMLTNAELDARREGDEVAFGLRTTGGSRGAAS